MTLEEAREFLADKRVFVKNKGKEVQEKLFELGFKWAALNERKVYKDRYFLFLSKDLKLTYIDVYEIEDFYEHRFKEISAEDVLNIKVERLPKTWKEFCKNNPIKKGEVSIICDSEIYTIQHPGPRRGNLDREVLPNSSAAEAHLALMQLHQLRDCYRKGSKFPYAISRNGSHLYISNNEDKFLSFQTKEIADEFLNNFRDLIKQAGDLI